VNYYKATRPDGTDFYTGTINYAKALETGEVIRHHLAQQVKDDPSTYLSVATVPTDCTGMRWPCRLFVVEPVGRVYKAGGLPNKRRVSALRVIEERPAHEALGPQGQEVAAIIERAERLTLDEAKRFYFAWVAAWDAGVAAWWAAWDAAFEAGRNAALCAAWDAAGDAAFEAGRDAVLATLVRDLISAEHYDLLMAPWRSAIGDVS
jgi:hypothetical protein